MFEFIFKRRHIQQANTLLAIKEFFSSHLLNRNTKKKEKKKKMKEDENARNSRLTYFRWFLFIFGCEEKKAK